MMKLTRREFVALAAGLQNQSEPARLPVNIYGTEGDWEDYSTPARDFRLLIATDVCD